MRSNKHFKMLKNIGMPKKGKGYGHNTMVKALSQGSEYKV